MPMAQPSVTLWIKAIKKMRFLFGILCLTGLIPQTFAQDVNRRATACPSDGSVKGYTSIADINKDQYDELIRISRGTVKPSPPYNFVLCPKTEFDVGPTPLRVLLSGTVISCGSTLNPNSSRQCSFKGGSTQVFLQDSEIHNYNLEFVTLIGLSFEQFNGTAIELEATETLELTLKDVVWKNFFSEFIIQQQKASEDAFPARVNIAAGTVDNGFAGSLFSNDGGILDIDRLHVSKVTAAGLISASNGGIVMMRSSTVTRSTIDTIASAAKGSILSIMDVEVHDMVFTNAIFHAENEGSKLFLNRTTVNFMNHDSKWKGVSVVDSAKAVLDDAIFAYNEQFENLVHAQAGAAVQISRGFFDGNIGRSPQSVSNLIYGIYNANIIIETTKFSDNKDVTAIAFASMESLVAMDQSCILSGSSDELVFTSSDSSFTHLENYVASSAESLRCTERNARLAVEQDGTLCYQSGEPTCKVSCESMADQKSCMADLILIGRAGNSTNTTGPDGNVTSVPTDTNATISPDVNATDIPSISPGNASTAPNATEAPTGNVTDTPSGNVTDVPTGTENATAPPSIEGSPGMNETMPPTETKTARLGVAFLIENDEMITDPAEINASGVGSAFPVYAQEVVDTLAASSRRKLSQNQRRRLEVSLVADSAIIYAIVETACPSSNNATTNETSSAVCHEAMGRYGLLLSSDEDLEEVSTTYTLATRSGIDDGSFQQILLQVEPNSSLVVGPSVDPSIPMPTDAPTKTPMAPTAPTSEPPEMLYPTHSPSCSPLRSSKSKSRMSSSSKSSSGKSMMGRKEMRGKGRKGYRMRHHRRHPRYPQGARKLAYYEFHEAEAPQEDLVVTTADEGGSTQARNPFENILKDHDEGGYYPLKEHGEEDVLYEEEEGEGEEETDEECLEPDDEPPKSSSRSKGKGSYYRQRQLRQDLPRIHGSAQHKNHDISDMRKRVESELNNNDLAELKNSNAYAMDERRHLQ